jgi:hypothetical protein
MGIGYNPKIVTNGLVLCLDAGNSKSYPGTGTTWTDLSGNGNNGTLTDGPTYSSSNGGSIVFDGTNDYIDLGNTTSSQFPHNQPWTFSLVGRVISQNSTFAGFLVKGSSVGSGVLFFYNSNFLYIKHNNSQPSVPINGTTPFSITWVHDGNGTTSIYLNGAYNKAGPTMASTETTNPLLLGRGDEFGNVAIYNCLKYNRALSPQEIRGNFNSIRGRYGI